MRIAHCRLSVFVLSSFSLISSFLLFAPSAQSDLKEDNQTYLRQQEERRQKLREQELRKNQERMANDLREKLSESKQELSTFRSIADRIAKIENQFSVFEYRNQACLDSIPELAPGIFTLGYRYLRGLRVDYCESFKSEIRGKIVDLQMDIPRLEQALRKVELDLLPPEELAHEKHVAHVAELQTIVEKAHKENEEKDRLHQEALKRNDEKIARARMERVAEEKREQERQELIKWNEEMRRAQIEGERRAEEESRKREIAELDQIAKLPFDRALLASEAQMMARQQKSSGPARDDFSGAWKNLHGQTFLITQDAGRGATVAEGQSVNAIEFEKVTDFPGSLIEHMRKRLNLVKVGVYQLHFSAQPDGSAVSGTFQAGIKLPTGEQAPFLIRGIVTARVGIRKEPTRLEKCYGEFHPRSITVKVSNIETANGGLRNDTGFIDSIYRYFLEAGIKALPTRLSYTDVLVEQFAQPTFRTPEDRLKCAEIQEASIIKSGPGGATPELTAARRAVVIPAAAAPMPSESATGNSDTRRTYDENGILIIRKGVPFHDPILDH